MEYDSCMSLIGTNLSYGMPIVDSLKVLEKEYNRQKELIFSIFAEKLKTADTLKKRTLASKTRDLKLNALGQVWDNVREDAPDFY